MVVCLTLATVASVVAAGGFYTRFEETNHNRAANARVWHVVICDIEQQVLRNSASPVNKVDFLKFYDHLLVSDVHAAPCGLQGRVK
jgi:hypothetical protein